MNKIKFLKNQLPKMTQSQGILGELITGIRQLMYLTGKEVLKKVHHQQKMQHQHVVKKLQNIILIKE